MYAFIMILGIAILLYGLYRGYKKDKPKSKTFDEIEHLSILEKRIELLENNWDIIYSKYRDILDGDSSTRKVNINDLNPKEDQVFTMADKYELFRKYKLNNYPLEKICKDLDMTKGEVLLLENLYRKSEE